MKVCHRTGGRQWRSLRRADHVHQSTLPLVDAFCSIAAGLFEELAAVTTWNAVIADEPGLAVSMT